MRRDRILRWRMTRGRHYLDLIEERRPEAPPAYVGLIDGREMVRAATQGGAGAALIQAACR